MISGHPALARTPIVAVRRGLFASVNFAWEEDKGILFETGIKIEFQSSNKKGPLEIWRRVSLKYIFITKLYLFYNFCVIGLRPFLKSSQFFKTYNLM